MMAKIWNQNLEEIPWITNEDSEDFYAALGNYRLRVEQMDKGRWWWAVTYCEQEIITRIPRIVNSKYRAIGIAEGVYEAHSLYFKQDPVIQFIQSKINQDSNKKPQP
jgi:hypothetical protein